MRRRVTLLGALPSALGLAVITALAAIAASTLACGGGGGGGGGPTAPPPPPPPSITFTASGTAAANSIMLATGAGSTADRLLLEVRANQVQDLYGVAFDLTYPTAQLRFQSRTQGTFLDGTFAISEAPPGNLVIGVTRLGAVPGVNGSGVLLTLEFTPVAAGNGTFSFSRNNALDSHGRSLNGGLWVAGTVQVVR